MTKETIKTFQYRITQATASQLVVILYDMAIEYLMHVRVIVLSRHIIIYIWHRRL